MTNEAQKDLEEWIKDFDSGLGGGEPNLADAFYFGIEWARENNEKKKAAHEEALILRQQVRELVEALELFKREHSSGHTMDFKKCHGCDLISAFETFRGSRG